MNHQGAEYLITGKSETMQEMAENADSLEALNCSLQTQAWTVVRSGALSSWICIPASCELLRAERLTNLDEPDLKSRHWLVFNFAVIAPS